MFDLPLETTHIANDMSCQQFLEGASEVARTSEESKCPVVSLFGVKKVEICRCLAYLATSQVVMDSPLSYNHEFEL